MRTPEAERPENVQSGTEDLLREPDRGSGSIPIINTYFLHADAQVAQTPGQLSAAGPTFKAQIDAMAAATANRPAVYLLELDGIKLIRVHPALGRTAHLEELSALRGQEDGLAAA